MTKVSVLGQANEENKPIELVKYLTANDFSVCENWMDINKFDEISLVSKKGHFQDEYDIIIGRTYSRDVLFLGHWNSGKL